MTRLSNEARMRAAQNLVRARMLAGFTSASAASRACKVPQKTYSDHEQGTRAFTKNINVYAEKFNVTAWDLLHGEVNRPKTHPIPHVDFTIIGAEKLDKLLAEAELSSLFDCGPKLFLATNPDDTMPPIRRGDVLGLCPDQRIRSGDFVVATIAGMEEPVFRRFSLHTGGNATYKALDPSYPDIKAKRGKWHNVARLQFVIRAPESIG